METTLSRLFQEAERGTPAAANTLFEARAMRWLIVDRVRRGAAQKRGGHFEITA